MKNLLIFCITIIIFSIGIMLGAELNSIGYEKQLAGEDKKIDSVQDTVIKNVQAEKKEDDEVRAVSAAEKKISPYATLTIEKYFKSCGHTTLDSIEIPKELVNMTKDELQARYEKWEIKKFEERDVYIYREIDANCASHFVVKEESGKVAVFAQITDNNLQYKEATNIDFENLRDEDKNMIKNGVHLYGKDELSSFIEDFES